MAVLPELFELLRSDFFDKICFYKQIKKHIQVQQLFLLASHNEASGSIPDIILMVK
jgi:hypothetical protein